MEQCLKMERAEIQNRLLTLAVVLLLSVFVIIGNGEAGYHRVNADYTEGIIEISEKTVTNGSIPDLTIEKPEEVAAPGESVITRPEVKLDGGVITFPEMKPDGGVITFPEIEPDGEMITLPETKPDGGIIIVPETESDMPEIPEAGDGVADVPSDEMGESMEADDPVETDRISDTPFLIDEAGMIYGFSPEYADMEDGILSLPTEGCVGIRSGAFLETGLEVLELYIPANITMMEEGALSGMNRLEWIEADAGNEAYISVEGVLFDSTMTSLYAFPAGRTGTYKIPESVTYIAYGAFDHTVLFEIDMRDCPDIDYSTLAGCPANLLLPRI